MTTATTPQTLTITMSHADLTRQCKALTLTANGGAEDIPWKNAHVVEDKYGYTWVRFNDGWKLCKILASGVSTEEFNKLYGPIEVVEEMLEDA